MKKVLVLGKIHNSGINFLKTNSYHVDELSDQNDLYKDKLELYDALIVKMTKVDNEFINHSKNLKIIARHGVGYNNIDLKIINSIKFDGHYVVIKNIECSEFWFNHMNNLFFADIASFEAAS